MSAGINVKHLRKFVVTPTLRDIGLWSQEAEELVLGTIAIESTMGYNIRQLGNEYARGLGQCEPPTFEWLVYDYLLAKHPDLYAKISRVCGIDKYKIEYLDWNLALAVALIRVRYLPAPGKIPQELAGQAAYWKKYYNASPNGRSAQDYIRIYDRLVRQA